MNDGLARQANVLEQVIEALRNGISPEELLANGIPQQVIDMAMQQLTQSVQDVPQEMGLAGAYMQNPSM